MDSCLIMATRRTSILLETAVDVMIVVVAIVTGHGHGHAREAAIVRNLLIDIASGPSPASATDIAVAVGHDGKKTASVEPQ